MVSLYSLDGLPAYPPTRDFPDFDQCHGHASPLRAEMDLDQPPVIALISRYIITSHHQNYNTTYRCRTMQYSTPYFYNDRYCYKNYDDK